MITEGIAVYGNNRYRMQTTSQHESSIEPDRILATRCTARTSHRNSTAKKKRAQELIKSTESYYLQLLRSVRVLLQGRQAGRHTCRSYQTASSNGKSIYGMVEQDNASHGWTGHVKAQSKLARLMLVMITGTAYNIIAYSCVVNDLAGDVEFIVLSRAVITDLHTPIHCILVHYSLHHTALCRATLHCSIPHCSSAPFMI